MAIAIPNKHTKTVAMEIFIHYICCFDSPVQIHLDNGKEFVSILNKELFKLWTLNTLQQLQGTCNVMHRQRSSTKLWQIIWLHLWTDLFGVGTIFADTTIFIQYM